MAALGNDKDCRLMNKKYENSRPSTPAEVKRAVEVESGHQCAVKGCFEHTYLEIHHIDHNRENNAVENLILLCDKHHKMAHANIIDRKSLIEYKKLNSTSVVHSPEPISTEKCSQLHIVDIFELDDVDDQATTIEVKLRNSGNTVVFLKEATFETSNHWEIITDKHHSLVEVSAKYDVEISEVTGDKSIIKVHQEIKPQETDRIHIRISTNHHSDPDGLSLFMLNIGFVYNEDAAIALSKPVILNIKPKFQSRGSYFPCYSLGTITKNKAVAMEVVNQKASGAHVEKYVLDALNSWLEAPSEEEYFDSAKNA